jgi:hypothetical protein
MGQFDAALLSRFNQRGPRYTSYPTADRFVQSFGPLDYAAAVARRRAGSLGGRSAAKGAVDACLHLSLAEIAFEDVVNRNRANAAAMPMAVGHEA